MRRIAFFVGSLVSEFQEKATATFFNAAKNKYDVELFTHLGSSNSSFFSKSSEQSMIDIPNLADYDGIIMLPDSLTQGGHYARLTEKIEKEAHCPVVSIRTKTDKYYNILTDDGEAMKTIVRHLINVHGLHKIAFMTGRMDLEDAVIRLENYKAVMEENGIEVTDRMIFEGDYWRLRGEEAVNWFLGGDERPEAIVCSNDYMALSVVEALQKRGIRVPEDIAVTGYDNMSESQLFEPRIASVDVPVEKMSIAALSVLERLMNGDDTPRDTYVPITTCFEGSCGCREHSRADMYRALFLENVELKNVVIQSGYMSTDYENCISIEELLNNAFRYSYNFSYKQIFICSGEDINPDELDEDADDVLEDEGRLTDNMILRCVISHDESTYEIMEQPFKRCDIIPPEYKKENDSLVVVTIKNRNMSYGYVVVRTEHPDELGRCFMLWMQNLSSGLEYVKMLNRNQEYLHFKYESRLDPLTGLYNRREMESILRRRRTGKDMSQFYIVALDLDGLKKINDTFGHATGDVAICAMATILMNIQDDRIKAARTGGDEFTLCVLAETDDEVEAVKTRINKEIADFNASSGEAFELSASIGYAQFNRATGLSRCIDDADRHMYEDKARRKKERR